MTWMERKGRHHIPSPIDTYMRNADRASFITAFVIGTIWAAPYAGKVLDMQETGGLPFAMWFGALITLGKLVDCAQFGTKSFAVLNAFFQTNEYLSFFGGTKELREETGCAVYDDAKLLTEAYNMEFLLMGVGQWIKERALKKGSIQK